jgi:hypothetical protein
LLFGSIFGQEKQWMRDFNAVSSDMDGIWRQMTINLFGIHSWPKLKPQ